MSKYKYLIIILMIMKSLSYSKARNLSDIFISMETNEMYYKRMGNRESLANIIYEECARRQYISQIVYSHQVTNCRYTEICLPYIGEKYEEYEKNIVKRNHGQFTKPITTLDYDGLMNSIPRINESIESVNERNKATATVLNLRLGKRLQDYKFQEYSNEIFDQLKKRYPHVYETYGEYCERMNNLKLEPLGKELFTCLKMFSPNLGELYEEYFLTRREKYNITGVDKVEFNSFKNSYPILNESFNTFTQRIGLIVLSERGVTNCYDYYKGLWSLIPIFSETYYEYTKRMEEKLLIPMKQESFIFYQAFYPNLCVKYEEFKATMDVLGKKTRFQDSDLKMYSKDIFIELKSKFPKPFESQEHYNDRISTNNDVHQVYDRFFAKRMYPKMSETFPEYWERIESIFFPKQSEINDHDYNIYKKTILKRISLNSFEKYKRGYPQFNLEFKNISYKIKDILTGEEEMLEVEELKMKIEEFNALLKKMPIVFETFSHYKQRMIMLALDGLDEEEFNDLKRTYIEQCETYYNYIIRMKALEIKPMDYIYALKFKLIVPREVDIDSTSYEDNFNARYKKIEEQDKEDPIISLEDSLFFIENPERAESAIDFSDPIEDRQYYYEIFSGKRSVVKFHRINSTIFILIHPSPFENYENYKKRIGEVQQKYTFKDSLNIESYERDIFKSFIQPLTENEFNDLKLRFPKLSETVDRYKTRLEEYDLTIEINTNFNLFKTFKRGQIQPFDDSESYELRYKKLESNKSKLLAKMHISFREEFDSFQSFLKTLDPNDYKDIMDVYPKYYHTLQEHNKIMEDRDLQPLETEIFTMVKEVFPHLLDNNFEEYESRVHNSEIYLKMKEDKNYLSILNENDFKQLKSVIPRRFESFKAYKDRTSINVYTADDIESFKHIYPKVCSTLDEFTLTMNNMGISLIKKTFEFYNNQFPERDETEYDKYQNRLTNLQVSAMSREEFDLLRSRFPKAPERYSNYIKYMESSLCPLDKSEFNDLKKLFSIPYETHAEHVHRLNSYSKNPLTLEEFRKEKSLRVLVGESFADHVVRIIDIFYPDPYGVHMNPYISSNINHLIKDKGMESLETENFIDHMLTYPFNYDSFEKFCSRQDEKKSKAESDPLVKTQQWYDRMKTLLPILSDNIEVYVRRAKEYKLEFPVITPKQFYRHIYGLPHPAEPFSIFDSRTQTKDSGNFRIIPPSAIPVPLPPLVDISPPTPSKAVSRRTRFISTIDMSPGKDTCLAISQRCTDPDKFDLCPEIHKFFDLKELKREVYKTFISLSPNFYIDHTNYSLMEQERRGDLLKQDEFLAFKECLPKLNETINTFNAKIKSMGLEPIKSSDFKKLKIFYPRIHQITYDNYILDIELKYDGSTADYRDIINKLKLSSDEFTEYKLRLPRQFDFSYSAYQKRMAKENISEILSEEDYNVTRKFNYPQVDETHKQYGQKIYPFGVDHIPHDIFNFFKGIYPSLLETKYEHRIKNYVYKFLRLPDYKEEKYNMKNKIISKIIKKSNPDQELQDKIKILLPQMMTNKELSLFIDRFPIIFQSYTNYVENWSKKYSDDLENLPLDKIIFDSLKTAYFMSIDETYEEYKTRMKSLKLLAVPRNIFRYCKTFYPYLINDYNDYTSNLKKYENFEIRKPDKYKFNKLLHLEKEIISEKDYQTFQNNFPNAFDIFIDIEHFQNIASIFNHDKFDSIKTCYYPRLTDDYKTYKTKMINLGLRVLDHKSFIIFKAIYPNPVSATDYSLYSKNFDDLIDKHYLGSSVDRRHLMTESEFNTSLPHDFPKLFQSWEEFWENTSILGINRLINDNGVYSKNVFNDLKMVFYPKLGQTMNSYIKYVVTIDVWCDIVIWNDYFQNAILLYPKFFDEYVIYSTQTLELPSSTQKYDLEYLKLDEERFKIFYLLFPLPYETYTQYEIRNKSKQFYLTEEEFSYYLQVFPQISEPYAKYKSRLKSELYVPSIVSNDLFKLFKELFPLIDELYNNYKIRFVNALKDSNEDTKKQLSFLVTYMEFKAMEFNDITESGGMTYGDFQLFKNSLPMPEELREDYIIRINDLAERKYNLGQDPPEILPLDLFNNLVEIYPKHDVSGYTAYCENMEKINVIPVSNHTFDKLVQVAKEMVENRFDVEPTLFNSIVVTA